MSELTSLQLREAIREKYAWPGGYALFGVCDDGGVLCCDCMRKEYKNIAKARRDNDTSGWLVVEIDNTSNCDGDVVCDHCGMTLR